MECFLTVNYESSVVIYIVWACIRSKQEDL